MTALSVPSPASAAAPHDPFQKYHGVLPDQFYDNLARCETGGNWQHSTRSYTGGLGIYRSTWRRWSNSSSAKGKTPAQQVKVADAIAFKSHINPDGTKVWRVGPWGWGCVKGQKSLQAFICRSRHTLVARWKRGCGTVHKHQ
ncbi:MAG: hypothetical protein EBY29_11610 [Planctomycetes bacterium]|nr:hypothetical protein [Planctomycetota bacterium]